MFCDDWEEVLIQIEKTEVNQNEIYWHYTSLQAMLSMFKIDMNSFQKCELLASNIRFLNDTQEYLEGKEVLKKIIEKEESRETIEKAMEKGVGEDIYTVSFCQNGDLLSQWQYYAKSSGIAIGFNLSNVKYVYYKGKEDVANADEKTRPQQCYYQDYIKLFNSLKANLSSNIQLIPPLFIPFCKNNAFKQENESRLVFYTIDNSKSIGVDFNFDYNSNNPIKIKPALRVQFLTKDSNQRLIDRIIVGPGENQNMVFNTLIHIFDRDNYMFYDDESFQNKEKEGTVTEGDYLRSKLYNSDIKLVEWEDKTERVDEKKKIRRWSYKCANGIIIMKSSIPFRG